jgi:hypothetical protein
MRDTNSINRRSLKPFAHADGPRASPTTSPATIERTRVSTTPTVSQLSLRLFISIDSPY